MLLKTGAIFKVEYWYVRYVEGWDVLDSRSEQERRETYKDGSESIGGI